MGKQYAAHPKTWRKLKNKIIKTGPTLNYTPSKQKYFINAPSGG
jgi:hypothetical protein